MAYGPHTKELLKRMNLIVNDTLDVSFLNIRKLPPLPVTLKNLNCSYSNLETLDNLPVNLENLNCAHTKFKILPLLPMTLKTLDTTNCKKLVLQRENDETIEIYSRRLETWYSENKPPY